MIIIGYQGIGKSTYAGINHRTIDLESGNFWNNGVRPDDWYIYYCNIAEHLSKQGFDVFVSSHEVVRNRLKKCCSEQVGVIIPSLDLSYEWRMKLKERYENSRLDKDYKAWMNAEDRYEDNIKEIINSGFPYVEISNMDYELFAKILELKNEIGE